MPNAPDPNPNAPKPHILASDKIPPEALVELTGYIGLSLLPDHFRFYSNLDFNSYCEVPNTAYKPELTIPGANELEPTTIYLKADTPIQVVSVQSSNVDASFLKGPITTTNFGGATRPTSTFFHLGGATQHPFFCFVLNTLQKHCTQVICPTPTIFQDANLFACTQAKNCSRVQCSVVHGGG